MVPTSMAVRVPINWLDKTCICNNVTTTKSLCIIILKKLCVTILIFKVAEHAEDYLQRNSLTIILKTALLFYMCDVGGKLLVDDRDCSL